MTVAAGRADASLLLDVFHLYKSGTPFTSLKQINGASLHVMHLNDYPQAADPSTLNDGNRDLSRGRRGAAPPDPSRPARQRVPRLLLARAVQHEYWAKSAEENLKTAMEKIRAVVRQALG